MREGRIKGEEENNSGLLYDVNGAEGGRRKGEAGFNGKCSCYLRQTSGNKYCLLPMGELCGVNLSRFMHIQMYLVTQNMMTDPDRVKKKKERKFLANVGTKYYY